MFSKIKFEERGGSSYLAYLSISYRWCYRAFTPRPTRYDGLSVHTYEQKKDCGEIVCLTGVKIADWEEDNDEEVDGSLLKNAISIVRGHMYYVCAAAAAAGVY